MRIFQMYFSAFLQPMRHVMGLCVLCLLLAAGTARATVGDVFKVDGITYKTLTTSTVQVGTGSNLAIADGRTTLNIPATVSYNGTSYSVTSIGGYAFFEYFGLTSVTLPESLTSIGNSSFSYCSGPTSITFPASLTSIGNNAFSYCVTLTSVKLPPSLTSIGNEAFICCEGLTSLTLPASLTSIGNGAFLKCTDLTSVTFQETSSLTTIGFNAFKWCTSLRSVTLPASLTSIGSHAFDGCSGLTSVALPASLTSISPGMLYYCSGLTSVALPASLTSIGDNAFSGCSRLTSIRLPASLTSIGSYAFSGCSGLTSITLPASLTSIGNNAFSYCVTVTSITLPASLTSIGNNAFSYCVNLTSITLPASLTSIGTQAFYVCSKLSTIRYLGISEPFIGGDAFTGGPSNRILYVPNASSGFTASKWGATSIVYGTGALSVILEPEAAVTAGAQWSIDGGATWNDSDTTLTGLALGEKTLVYKPLTGWTRPGETSVTIVANQTTTAAGTYILQTGALRVLLEPEDVTTLGAQWSIDGGATWNSSGAILTGLTLGEKTVTYKSVPGWKTPNQVFVTVFNGQTATATGTYTAFDIELVDGNFTAGAVTPLTPGSPVDVSWTIQSSAANQTPFWCEVFASKTGGFDQVRFGSTVTNSYSAAGTEGTTQTIAPPNQILKTLPDGAYSLMPVVNRYATRTMEESDYVNNWTTIAGKRLRVHTTEVASSDLVMDFINVGADPTDPEQLWIIGLVRNEGDKPLPADGCWIEGFYGYLSAEGTLDPLNTIGAGFNLKNLDPGQETSFSLTSRIPGGAANFAVAAIVDSTDIIPESNEANNSKLWYPEGALPTPPQNGIDLTVTNVTLDPMQTAPHLLAPVTLFNCSVTVKNNGTADAGPVWIELFGSQDGGVSFVRGATLTDSLYVAAPAPGESQTYSFANMPVKSIGDGMYTIVAIVNRDGAPGNPGDSKPLDNRMVYSAGRVSLSTPTQPGTVNLVWSEGPTFTLTNGPTPTVTDKQNGTTGSLLWTWTVTGKVKNVGAVASKAFWTEAFIGELDEHMGFFTRDSVVFAGGVLCEGLAPDAEQEITISGPATPGKTVGILTDSTDLIAETDETDNYDYSNLTY